MDNPVRHKPEDGDTRLQEFFEICQHIYERHVREDTWPWTPDSTDSEDVIESESTDNDL